MGQMTDVAAHYASGSLLERVTGALQKAGLAEGILGWESVAALDQFHVRGLAASRELADALTIAAGDTVLDIGSGLGGPARFLAATYGCHVTGIDLTEAFVEVATMLAERTGLADRVTYRQADALDLPFPAGQFDLAWTQHVAMNIADRGRLYGEMFRVLKPGGRLAIYDVVATDGGEMIYPVPWAGQAEISFPVTSPVMRIALEAAGFTVMSWQDRTAAGLEWYDPQQAARAAQTAPPVLGVHVAMSPGFAGMVGNLGRNLREGRAGLVQAVVRKP